MIILDTNVVSELMRESPSLPVLTWWNSQTVTDMYIAAVVEAELRHGTAILPAGRRRDRLFVSIDLMLSDHFPDRILAFDRAAAREYAEIMANRRAIGRSMDRHELDCMIAATARVNAAAVATRNVRDFTGCGVQVINPWETGGTA